MIFLDTSALVKAYIDEPGSEAVRAVIHRSDRSLVFSDHVALETLATFAYMRRDKRISRSSYRKVRTAFLADYKDRFERLLVGADILQTAMRLAHDHWKLGVGTVDLIHIATAMQIRAERSPPSFTVACADRSMRLLASAAGFQVFDPENDEVARLGAAVN